jgi:hypothetical protein
MNNLAWEKAKDHLQETRQQYAEIGASGIPALTLILNPLLIRYEKGERTQELYDEIMESE